MEIFKVGVDSDEYQLLLPTSDSDSVYEMLDINGMTKLINWSPIEFYVDNPLAKRGIFFSLSNGSAFCCDQNAAYKLSDFLGLGSELLPIFLEDGTKLFIVNVIDCINALDDRNTEYDYYEDGTRSNRILKYAFHKNRFHESSIFKIPETANIQVLTYTGVLSPEDEFLTAYNESGLTGLIFSMLFES